MSKLAIKEIIVVEGRDDQAALKRVADAEIIITHGFALNQRTIHRILSAAERFGVIIFTDPDFAGKNLRKKLASLLRAERYCVKHAFISRQEALKNGDIGVENATDNVLIDALIKAQPTRQCVDTRYTMDDMYALGLSGSTGARALRTAVAQHFRIGYGNAKQMRQRLNKFAVNRAELERFIKGELDDESTDLTEVHKRHHGAKSGSFF